jgi:hypothetical protein
MRRSQYAAAPNEAPIAPVTMVMPMLSTPRTGSMWARPNSAACTPIASTGTQRDSRLRNNTARNAISSTIGAAITASNSVETTYVRFHAPSSMPSRLLRTGMRVARMIRATTIWTPNVAIHTSGPQPRSTGRNSSPNRCRHGSARTRRVATMHQASTGP